MIKNGCAAAGDTDMYYAAFGKGEKTLIVLPGLSDGLATVKGKALFLAAPYKPFLNDFTVYMFSRKNRMPEGCTIADMADDQAVVMKMLGLKSACVLGVSQGGMIAQYLAIRHPETVDRLVLAVTAPYANDTAADAVTNWKRMAERRDHVSLMADTAEKTYSEGYLKKNRKLLSLAARFTRPSDYERFMRNAEAILSFDASGELCKIAAPTLIIAGSDDRTVGSGAAEELHRGIKGSELFVYEGLGHGLFEEAKDFYDRVFEFCRR